MGFIAYKDAVSTTEVLCPWESLPLPPSGSLWAEILVSGGVPTVPLISGKHFRPWKEQLTIPSPSFPLLTYMDACVCVFISDLPATQLVADNYNSWLAFSWKHQIPCLARPPQSSSPHCLWPPRPTILSPFYLCLSSTTLILSEQDVPPCFWQDLLQSHATKTQHSFQIQKVGFITAF